MVLDRWSPQPELAAKTRRLNHHDEEHCDVLSWSGEKDSFLALDAMAREGLRDVTPPDDP